MTEETINNTIEDTIKETFIESYKCPLTHEVFNIPVTLSDGHTYEKKLIIKHLKNNNTSPLTNLTITDDINNLTTNYAIKNAIENLLKLNIITEEDIYDNNKKQSIETIYDFKFFEKYGKNDEIIKKIIDSYNNKNTVLYRSHCLIHMLCMHSNLSMIKYLVSKKINLECETSNGWRAIHYVCMFSTIDTIKYIVNLNVNLLIKTSQKHTIMDLVKFNNNIVDKNKFICTYLYIKYYEYYCENEPYEEDYENETDIYSKNSDGKENAKNNNKCIIS